MARSTEPSALYTAIRAAIARSGLSLLQLESQTGIDNSALSRFVRGERGLSIENVQRLMDLFGLRVVGPDDIPAGDRTESTGQDKPMGKRK